MGQSGTGDAAGAILYSVDGNDTASKGLWSFAIRDCDSRQSSGRGRPACRRPPHLDTSVWRSVAVDGLTSDVCRRVDAVITWLAKW